MKHQAVFFSTCTAVTLALPAFATDSASGMLEVRWGKNAFNFEGTPSGPQPLRNLSRLPNGKANAGQLVGDFRNPILTPEAAAVVKQKGESLPSPERAFRMRRINAGRLRHPLPLRCSLALRCCRRRTAILSFFTIRT